MFDVLEKKILAPGVKLIKVSAPIIAKKSLPGQFVILRVTENGERIPLTIADKDKEKGTITIVFQEVGKTTKLLGRLEENDKILDLVGPLGNPTEIDNFGTVIGVGGGVGIAALYPILKALKETGNYVISIIGGRSRDYVIFKDEIEKISDEIYITTDDGSLGRKGFVSDVLKEILDSDKEIDRIWAVGPTIMMKVVSDVTRPFHISTIVSLNPIMVDGTGMCGGCRVTVGGKNKFTCIDGPEFDGHLVDFDELLLRLRTYKEEETLALKLFEEREGEEIGSF
ncbi:MAG TPA: sulfide/dihydroorotate dehydrogenase-like FAD/NAD-binding protein [Dictyoglomaceae bacterium]|nr:sulfide/dihydroorotate dehydrogenase-like FAD/NAD-binding protein [Dictyoglomaceae bacterium]HOL38751.1 sulfide/dihydroorotate dehydrogenase-like FAD/NAD-binding protein [Dictyoglomaceae bacterium]HOP94545.1 sulfide/dihydroorotate dehydrogenase-like FAD/NAD-binding protein [Dictyoglomaceae bacterium]HPP15500.1 sulfide/dihydroorotate dehydrogenase-like FAD/NAD-binding protein [Dictyoglomaceae bacterium]HPU43091.1 sulfide/dihydroorotate dehydrogenase-like FAD/NAD-binding protein [Dictyoglomace